MKSPGRPVTGAGGVLLIVSLFLPWAGAGGVDRTGFELLTTADVFLLIAGLGAAVPPPGGASSRSLWKTVSDLPCPPALTASALLVGVPTGTTDRPSV